MRDVVLGPEPPAGTGVLECQVTPIAERDVPERELRELPAQALPRHIGEPVLQPLLGVRIHDVPEMPVRDEDVLPPVQIDVEEHGGPRPSARLHPRIQRRLGERAVAAIEKERVPLLLELGLEVAGPLGQRRVRRHLGLQPMRVVAQHVDLEQVGPAIAVHVGDVDAHGRIRDLSLSRPVGEAEAAAAVVVPELVSVLEVVRQVEVWCAVAVEVDELGA